MRRLVVFDFDGTLFRSPDRVAGSAAYLAATGTPWPHAGWWGRVETLLPPVVADPAGLFIENTVAACRRDRLDKNTRLVFMTGRPVRCRQAVLDILAVPGLVFDDYYFRGMPGERHKDTLDIKIDIIENKLLRPGLEAVEIWEDRPEHVAGFRAAGRRWKLKNFTVHDVGQMGQAAA